MNVLMCCFWASEQGKDSSSWLTAIDNIIADFKLEVSFHSFKFFFCSFVFNCGSGSFCNFLNFFPKRQFCQIWLFEEWNVNITISDVDCLIFISALMMSIKLGEKKLVQYVIESVPHSHIELCVSTLADVYVVRCVKHIVAILENSKHVEFYLRWIRHLLTIHGAKLRAPESMHVLLSLHKNLTKCYDELAKM